MPFIAIFTVYTGTDDIVAHNNGLVRTKNILVNAVSDLRNTWQLLQQRMLVNFCKKLLLGLQRLFFGLIRKRWNRGFDSLWLAFTSFGSSVTALCIVLTSEPHIEVLAHFSYDQLATLHATYFVERFYSVSPTRSFRAHWDNLGVRARKRNHTSTRLVSNPLRYQRMQVG